MDRRRLFFGAIQGTIEGWNITTSTYLQSFSTNTQDASVFDTFFKPDGLKMYIVGNANNSVYEYDLSVAWDVTSATYLQLFDVGSQQTVPYGVNFKPDGLKMYVTGSISDKVCEYDLSTAWDITTATYLQLFSYATQSTGAYSVIFKPDGLKMYLQGIGFGVYEYDLSIAWDISTATYLQSFSVTAQDTLPLALFFKPDGLSFYITGSTNDSIYRYNLSTAWDISTAVYINSYSVSAQNANPISLFFKPDGLKMYSSDLATSIIYEYDLTS